MATNNQKKTDRKQLFTRIICLSLAAIMVLTTVIAAVLSQVW